ncbi:lipid asymmetry maintenance protein MlaB [Shimwellia pseudoproteus]|uniref:lipid asymmetry maintenance protein MlaB n=1 Tax=Shimwellia pseudoproteus TaxID=570012 RepID=UPI0018EC33E5|nr:lipid asymmetry maintenance protein MlaB [Shimwellia pseudoproteus]MBJ3814859.1 lipid asymmetry maintenance protein MlaB [Shimwellia pseudoproteus]
MSEALQWSLQDDCLMLTGELGSDTLLPLWDAREEVVSRLQRIDLSGVQRVDTGGVALLIHLVALARDLGHTPVVTGSDENLHTLVKLYNLPPEVIPFDVA